MKKKILVIGQGGREHAIAWKLSLSPFVEKVIVIPGNDGMVSNKIEIKKMDSTNFKQLIKFAKEENIYLTIVGPEMELSLGIVDEFESHGLKIFGPNKYATQLESSKSFCKEKMNEFDIPTANYQKFTNIDEANKYVAHLSFPIVIKANGLAAGKGVSIVNTIDESKKVIHEYLGNKKFGNASKEIIIEEYLVGEEFSQLAFVYKDKILYMQIAKDYKRAFDNDNGDNTGGMGCYTPVELPQHVINQGHTIIKKMALGMSKNKTPFVGILYAGLMNTKNGVKTIEFNARFGDPETEVILSAMKSDLFLIIDNLMNGKVLEIEWDTKSYVGVVLASKGYPNSYNKKIQLPNFNSCNIFYMGVIKENDKLLSNGGRVLISIGSDSDKKIARKKAYETLKINDWNNFFFRKDIAN